jgi:hypothetical protein
LLIKLISGCERGKQCLRPALADCANFELGAGVKEGRMALAPVPLKVGTGMLGAWDVQKE